MACCRHFIPRGYSTNFYGEALPRGLCPYLSTYHFWQKRFSFRIPFHPFWRLRGGVACYRHFKMISDHTRVDGKKDCLIKIKLARYFAVSFFFSNKIVLTYSDLELFEQGSLYAVSTWLWQGNRQCEARWPVVTSVHKAGLTIYEIFWLGNTEKCPFSVFTVVRIKRVGETTWASINMKDYWISV